MKYIGGDSAEWGETGGQVLICLIGSQGSQKRRFLYKFGMTTA